MLPHHSSSSCEKEPLVSIITVVYQGVEHLEASITNVLAQKNGDIEYIIIDGGSSDGTVEVLEKYDSDIDFWLSEPDRGIYHAMNKGIAHASGKWVIFMGADDLLIGELHSAIKLLKRNSVIYYGDVILSSTNKKYGGKFTPFRLLKENIPHQAIFYPAMILKKYAFNERYRLLADYELNIKLICGHICEAEYIGKVVTLYNDETGLSSVCEDEVFSNDKWRLVLTHCRLSISIIYSLYKGLKFVRTIVK